MTVKARRVPVKVKTDRLVYNMKANPMKDGNALESFRYIPFITANDKEISIIGKESTQIYINGHKCTLSGETLQAYLRSLPANDIESIEILHSPNATYRGEGNFGVINIILKNKKKNGMQGLANLTLTKKNTFLWVRRPRIDDPEKQILHKHYGRRSTYKQYPIYILREPI